MFIGFYIENKDGKTIKQVLPVGSEATQFAETLDKQGAKWRLGKA